MLERDGKTDELTPVSVIAAELGCRQHVRGREICGTAAQVQRMDEARRQAEANRADPQPE
ncbi:hypothetical protein [Rhodococcus opacus]|uniref:hypothetical protein n=1 Tax=Rhodococcus opacus TaxID=37919 RepID=UPI000A57C276|nr:hypothetical protein [Rhodococcus opacus]